MYLKPIRILLVEDQPRFRAILTQSIIGAPSLELVAACTCVGDARAAIEREVIDIALVDLRLPDGSGLDVIKAVKRRRPSCDVMVISMFGDEDVVLASIEAGATGYLLKDSMPTELIACIRDLHAGGAPMSPMIARLLLDRVRASTVNNEGVMYRFATDTERLTERELEILRAVAKGFTFSEIAGYLSISPNTVKTHVKRVYRKLAVSSRSEAVYEAHHMGLLNSVFGAAESSAGGDRDPRDR
jgi:DNA-binding NarL/FixJ family response regulator